MVENMANPFLVSKMIPHRAAVSLLAEQLGSGVDWHWQLCDARLGRLDWYIPFHREKNRRIFYRVDDILAFIESRKRA